MHFNAKHYLNEVNSYKNAAIKGKRFCRFHASKSTGPITIDGKQRCAQTKIVYERETRKKRRLRADKFKEMKIQGFYWNKFNLI